MLYCTPSLQCTSPTDIQTCPGRFPNLHYISNTLFSTHPSYINNKVIRWFKWLKKCFKQWYHHQISLRHSRIENNAFEYPTHNKGNTVHDFTTHKHAWITYFPPCWSSSEDTLYPLHNRMLNLILLKWILNALKGDMKTKPSI